MLATILLNASITGSKTNSVCPTHSRSCSSSHVFLEEAEFLLAVEFTCLPSRISSRKSYLGDIKLFSFAAKSSACRGNVAMPTAACSHQYLRAHRLACCRAVWFGLLYSAQTMVRIPVHLQQRIEIRKGSRSLNLLSRPETIHSLSFSLRHLAAGQDRKRSPHPL